MVLLFVLLLGTLTHDFHMGKALLEYNSKDQALQITLHLFLDDLELALERKGISSLFLCTEQEAAHADESVRQYIQEALTIWVNGKQIQLRYLGKEMAEDLMGGWFYLEGGPLAPPQTIEVDNRLLMEVYDDQKNIISVRQDRAIKGYFLVQRGDTRRKVEF